MRSETKASVFLLGLGAIMSGGVWGMYLWGPEQAGADIGGGFILLLGYVFLAAGLILPVIFWWSGRQETKKR